MPRRPTDPEIQRAVGARLANARRVAGMTQEVLAGKLAIEAGTLSRYEQGHVALPVPLLVSAARALGVDPARLVEGLGHGQKEPTPELQTLWDGLTASRKAAVLRLLREMQGA